jgi:hypothetical protein
VKLGGLKYARMINDDGYISPDEVPAPGPEEWDAERVYDNDYHNDKYQVAIMLYFFLTLTYSDNIPRNFVPDWSEERNYDFKRLHMKHLVKLILSDPILSIPDLLTHPFFMSPSEMASFEDGLRTCTLRNRSMDAHLEEGKANVFTEQWTTGLDKELVELCLSNTSNPHLERSFVGLWEARRYRSGDEDSQKIRDMGHTQEDNFMFWESAFPAFFLHLFTRIVSFEICRNLFIYATYEFKRPVCFPASPRFYNACANIPIYELE